MSNVDFFSAQVGPAQPAVPAQQPAPRQRRRLLMAGVALGAGVLLLGAFVVLDRGPRDDRPAVLPETFAGLSPADALYQFGDQGDWRSQLTKVYGDHPFAGRAFGAPRPTALVNLVVVRTDSRDEGDPALGRPPFTQVGEVTCTHTFELGDLPGDVGDHRPFRKDSMLLCWRASATLTVSALVLFGGLGSSRRPLGRSTRSGPCSSDRVMVIAARQPTRTGQTPVAPGGC